MTEFEDRLRDALPQRQHDMEAGRVSDFDDVWADAQRHVARRRRRYRAIGGLAGAAAVIAVVAVGLMRPAEQEWQYVNPDDLESSTSWIAPSDVLLPEYRFDIYEEIPVLIESTGSAEGALL